MGVCDLASSFDSESWLDFIVEALGYQYDEMSRVDLREWKKEETDPEELDPVALIVERRRRTAGFGFVVRKILAGLPRGQCFIRCASSVFGSADVGVRFKRSGVNRSRDDLQPS